MELLYHLELLMVEIFVVFIRLVMLATASFLITRFEMLSYKRIN